MAVAVCAALQSSSTSRLSSVYNIPSPSSAAAALVRLPYLSSSFANSLSCSLLPRTVHESCGFVGSHSPRLPAAGVRTTDVIEEEETEDDEDDEDDIEEEEEEVRPFAQQEILPVVREGFQLLGTKEKKELRAYAHGLGSRLNVQQVGKLGVSQTVVNSISDALEAHEIVKVKVLVNSPSEMDEIIVLLERGTGGQVVGKIGRTVLLYRASLRKLEAANKRPDKPKKRRKSKLAMSAGRKSYDLERSRE